GKRHKTCKRCKENRDRKKEDKLQDADSLDDCELIQQDSSKILPEEDITHATIVVESS
ncbi:5880_t:CDS:1, partial [Ambispora leptoticha]